MALKPLVPSFIGEFDDPCVCLYAYVKLENKYNVVVIVDTLFHLDGLLKLDQVLLSYDSLVSNSPKIRRR